MSFGDIAMITITSVNKTTINTYKERKNKYLIDFVYFSSFFNSILFILYIKLIFKMNVYHK